MTRQEFLQELQAALQGEMSQSSINGHIKYYQNYIIEEVQKGQTEEDVIRGMGNPRLIAKTLIDTSEQFGESVGEEYYSENYSHETYKKGKGFHANYSETDGWDVRFGKLKLNSWYGKLLLIFLAITVIVIAAQLVAFLLPVIVVGVLILMIILLILGNRR